MAIDLGRTKSTPPGKYDSLVASQLKQAETRIRVLDLTAGLLGFAALSLAYIVGMVVCDSRLLLSPFARQLSLFAFLGGAAVYLYFAVIRPLRLRVNPYYAARQVEQQLPQAKNSIVNWVDLHEQTLSPAIRGALGQRAAKDLSHVDLDRAISSRRAAWMGGLAGLFAVAFIASFFLLGPKPFLSLLQRTFNPFGSGGVSTRTQLRLLKPEGGNAAVTVGRGVNFLVEVNGKVPHPKGADAVKLLYRYEEGDPWLERLLIQEPSRDWATSLSAIEVKNGFWYKITGGDAETEEYRVGVRAAPAITDFLATFRFRPYVARADLVRRERELKELRGTEVLMRVRTNRALRDGRLEFESNRRAGGVNPPVTSAPGELDPNDPQTLLVRFVLDEDGKYRLCFTSTDGEAYSDAVSYPVTAIPDKPPTVELTKPGKDIRLPADALLQLEGKAGDDVGVKSLVLRMRVIGGDTLRGQPYRSDEQLRLADGGYPHELEYKDFVELSRVKNEKGQAVPLRAGMELEYWLEASDACDYPRPNVGESKHYRVLLTDPEKNQEKQKQQKQQADKDKKQHDQQQDQKRQKENQDRQQQRQEQENRNKEEENKNKGEENKGQNGGEGNKGAGGGKSQSKQDEQANNGESKDNSRQKGDSKGGQGEQNSGEQQGGQSQDDQSIEDRIKKALEKKQAGQNGKGEGQPDKNDQGEGKGAQTDKADGNDKSNGENKGSKGAHEPDAKKTGADKDQGRPQAGRDPAQGDAKGENTPSPKPGAKNEPKGGDARNQAGKGGENKPETLPQPGEKKAAGEPQAKKGTGESTPKPMGQDKEPTKGDKQPAGDKKGKGERRTTGEIKDNREKSTGKSDRKDPGKGEKKQNSSGSKDKQSEQGDARSSPDQRSHEKSAKTEKKPEPATQKRNATEQEIQDLARRLQSKDPREREQAKEQLQRIEKGADDRESREKAGEALKKAGQPEGPAEDGTPKKGNDSSGKPKDEHKDGEKNDGSKDAGSSGDKNGEKEKAKSAGKKNGQGEKNEKGPSSSSGGEPPGSQNAAGGNTPGGGGERQKGEGNSARPDELPPPNPAKPRDHRAAQMQLEDFAKKVDKNILKDAGVSEEAWKKFLESKRKQLAPREKPRPEGPSSPQQANQLPSMGGRTIQPAATGQGDTHGPDRGQPLPQYRDAFRKFTRQMSEKK